MIQIKNCRVVNPKLQQDEVCDLWIEDGVIKKIGSYSGKVDQVIDATGLVAAPGLVDIHVHFRDPGYTYKEDLYTGSKAAAKGGFTSVVCMANTDPIIDNVELINELYERAKDCDVHLYFASAMSKRFDGKHMCDYEAMQKAGAVCFTDDGKPLCDTVFLQEAMNEIAKLNGLISLHEELPEYVKEAGIHAGNVAQSMGLTGAMREAEYKIIERDMKIAEKCNARMHVQHISSKEAVELVRQGKQAGLMISAEATPHHFALTHEAVIKHGTLAKMNPPLREESDRQAILKGLKDGTIDVIATDHAPHSETEKNKPFCEAPSGIIGLETALSLGIEYLVESGVLTLSQLIEKMSVNPAKLLGIDAGVIDVNKPADLILFDPKETYVLDEFASKSNNSPFLHATMHGKVKFTMVAGKIVYSELS